MISGYLKTGFVTLGLGMAGLMATGCFFGEGGAPPQDGPRPAPTLRCAELSPDQQRRGDSLVALAQKLQTEDVEMMASPGTAGWKAVDETRIHASMAYYDQALAAAPGHCSAVFGRAMAQGMLLLQDAGVNQAVQQALPKAGGSERPLAQAFKSSPDEAAPLILRIATGMEAAEKPFITSEQDRIALEILPTLDSVIASLEAVMAHGDFSATFTRADGRLIELDQGEIGPVLGGLKVAKAVVLLLCGIQWEIAHDGSYDWIDRLQALHAGDFQELAPAQREALDHVVGLFQPASPFTRVKPAWKTSVRGIPAVLLEAVENTQAGLRYAIAEGAVPGKQVNDLYRVGVTEDDDVDPADLRGVVDALERTKKYLRGEVTLVYHRTRAGVATHTLKLVFPKVFGWDGVQAFLPYFKVNPYEQWVGERPKRNPEVSDWESGPSYGMAFKEIMQALDLSTEDDIFLDATGAGGFKVVLRENDGGWFTAGYRGPDMVLAILTPEGGNPCRLHFVKTYDRRRVRPTPIFADEDTFILEQEAGEGAVDLSKACRVDPAGVVQYRFEDSLEYRSPFHFTDPQGRKTLEAMEAGEAIDSLGLPAALTGKVFFRDPTFGGVFPELTNANIWTVMETADGAGPKLDEDCADPSGSDCRPVLPNNPSDLDVWAYYLFWLDNLF